MLQVPPCPFPSRSEGWSQGSLPTATSHSAKTFPSVGGAVTFLVRGYGEGVASGSLNLFQYFSYIITIALYATGFAAYAVTFIHLPSKVWAVGVVLAFTAINFLGSRLMGRAESVIVIIKVAILIVFIVAAFMALTGKGVVRLSPAAWPGPLAIFTGAGVLFVGYEGFGLITNAAANMAKPKRELPRAIYGSVAIVIVIYLLVASGVVTNVPLDVLKGLGEFRLGRRSQAVPGTSGIQVDRHRGLAFDCIRSQRHLVRVYEHRLSDRQERRSSTGVRPQALGS